MNGVPYAVRNPFWGSAVVRRPLRNVRDYDFSLFKVVSLFNLIYRVGLTEDLRNCVTWPSFNLIELTAAVTDFQFDWQVTVRFCENFIQSRALICNRIPVTLNPNILVRPSHVMSRASKVRVESRRSEILSQQFCFCPFFRAFRLIGRRLDIVRGVSSGPFG